MRRLIVAALLLGGLWPAPVRAQSSPDTTQVLRLPDLLVELHTRNPSLRAARLEAEAWAARSRRVTALPEPTVSVTLQPFPVYTARGIQRSQWRVEQRIPYPGTLERQGAIAESSAEVARYEAETVARDLALDLMQRYADLYRIQEQQRLLADFRERLRAFEAAATTRYEVGEGTQQAILKAQLERHRLRLQEEQLAESARTAREDLARLLNRPPEALPAGRLAPPTVEALPDTSLAAALRRRPEVKALEAALHRATHQIELARLQLRPGFMVSATYFDIAESDVPAMADGRDALALGVGVSIPLWRSALRAGIEEAEVRRRQVEARREALTTAIRTHIADLTERLDRQRTRLTLLQQALIPQAEAAREASLSAYTTGRATFLDLLDAERTLFALQMEREDTAARLFQTMAALERALGQIEGRSATAE